MPIFFQQKIDPETKLGMWKIEEPEDFFLKHVLPQRNVRHKQKKLQHLAGRFLLKYLMPVFSTESIQITDNRKPYLEDEGYHFSISHCGPYAAAIVSKNNRTGVDVELISGKAEKVKQKFLSEGEWTLFNDQLSVNAKSAARNFEFVKTNVPEIQLIDYSTLLWSCKEAVFKWYGLGGVDFKEHIVIEKIERNEKAFITKVHFKKKYDLYLDIHSIMFDDVCLSWVVS